MLVAYLENMNELRIFLPEALTYDNLSSKLMTACQARRCPMPSATFYNLPEEKRERLLRAAREEFSRVPYESARDDHRPRIRGRFTCTHDKEELFGHLMDSYGALLERRDGGAAGAAGGGPLCRLPGPV